MPMSPDIKILLVEDAQTMRKMEIRILNQLGYSTIIEAADGDEAIRILEATTDIQLVISDWAMPNRNGLELLQWIRGAESLAELPFIMATGQGDKEHVARALEAGASGVVAKPFTPNELDNLIKTLFGLRTQEAPKQESRPRETVDGKVRLKMAHIQITDHLTLGVLQHLIRSGQHTPEHFELETLCMPGWNPVQKALEQGDVAGAFILAPAAMDLFSYDIDIRLVLFAHRNGSITVRNRAGDYRKPYQQFFKHKTFYIPHKMSIHNMLAHMYFTRMGLKPGVAGSEAVNVLFDVVPPVKMPEFLAENENSCGFMVAEPIGSRAVAAGIAERQFLSSEIWDNHPCCVAVFRDEFLGRYPDAVQEFTNLLVKAGRYIQDFPDPSADIAVDFLDPDKKLGLSSPLLKSVLTEPKGIRTDNLYPDLTDLDTIQQYMTREMGIGRLIDLEKFVDTRFADIACRDTRSTAATATTDRSDAPIEVSAGPAEAVATKTTTDRPVFGKSITTTANREGKYLIFGLAGERYGASVLDVREIIGLVPITPIPRVPDYVKGVINLRDKVIPVVDMRLKFGLESDEYSERTCIIVVEISGRGGSSLMGVVVDSVEEVTDVREEEIENTPQFGDGLQLDYIIGLAKKATGVIILLDIDQILHTADILNLTQKV